jgi:hypothetical protein
MFRKFGNCFKEKENKLGSGYLLPNYSNNLRKINIVKYAKGGRTYFGLYNEPLILNDYGKIEGSPGGYGSSPKNKY